MFRFSSIYEIHYFWQILDIFFEWCIYLFIDFIFYFYFLFKTLFSATFADLHTFPIRLFTFVKIKKLYPSHPRPNFTPTTRWSPDSGPSHFIPCFL